MANSQGCWNWYERRSGKADAEAATVLAAVDQVARRHPWTCHVWPWRACRRVPAWLRCSRRCTPRGSAPWPCIGVAPGTAESAANALAAMRGTRDAQLPDAWPALPAAMTDTGLPAAPRDCACRPCWCCMAMPTAWCPCATPQPQRCSGPRRRAPVPRQSAPWRAGSGIRCGRWTSSCAASWPCRCAKLPGWTHAWSGGASRWSYSDPAGPDASALIWAFVARQFKKI